MPDDGTPKRRGRVFSIAAGEPFLATLAHALVEGRLGIDMPLADPVALARCTIYLPTRRAVRAFRPILAQTLEAMTGQQAMLLPRLVPLGDGDEAEVLLALSAGADILPPVMPPLQRRLKLTRLVSAWARTVNRSMLSLPEGRALLPRSLAEAFALSADLARAIDDFGIHDVGFAAVEAIDLHRLDQYWELTARFLAIAGREWPAELAQSGFIESSQRDRLLVEGMIRHWHHHGTDPVVAAGSTGSVPATAQLLDAIARLPRGAVVLPDLDLTMDETSFHQVSEKGTAAEAAHPQAILSQLLLRFGVGRDEVVPLSSPAGLDKAPPARRALLTEAFRPVATTSEWATIDARLAAESRAGAFAGIDILEAPDERLEALAIAAVLRKALETPGQTAALVTPDRKLAERVTHELRRWNIDVDDTAGLSLRRTQAGVLATALLRLVRPGFLAQDIVALLSLRLAAFGCPEPDRARAAAAIEIGALRGARPLAAVTLLPDAVSAIPDRIAADRHTPGPRRRLPAADIALAHGLAQQIVAALAPLLQEAEARPVTAWAGLHRAAILAAARRPDGTSHLDGMAEADLLLDLLTELEAASSDAPEGTLEDYIALFEELAGERILRVSHRQHPRLKILGLLEARLLDADLVVLGGLSDGIWPPEVTSDAFLNRALRKGLGLPSPERRIGQTAHDFVQAAMAPRVVLARPLKSGTTQTIPSRFLQRLAAVSDKTAWDAALGRGQALLDQLVQLDRPDSFTPCPRPEPVVAAARQPLRLSVTEIETLYRDPYAIYARHVLGLQPLEPQEVALGHSDRGSVLHDIVARFADVYATTAEGDRARVLDRIATEAFAPFMEDLEVQQFWWPSWQRLSGEVLAWEAARRPAMVALATEAPARWLIPLEDGTEFLLTARADRVEKLQDGTLRLVDFKTGSIPNTKHVTSGLAPQLTLQAAMAPNVPFGHMAEAPASWAGYVALKPGALHDRPVAFEAQELGDLAGRHLAGLKLALKAYRSGARGFASRLVPRDLRYPGAYDHLARVAEWQRDDGEDSDA